MSTLGGSRPVVVASLPDIDGLALRTFDPAVDFPALAELVCTVNRFDGVDFLPSAESLRNDWTHLDGFDLAEDVVVAEHHGDMAGYAEHSWRVRDGVGVHHLHVAVTPAVRRSGVGRVLLRWAEARVTNGLLAGGLGADLGIPHRLSGWADLEVSDALPWATDAGYAAGGYGVMMTRTLADPIPNLALPSELELRTVLPEDHRAIWDADTEAFRDHRDHAVRTEADYVGWFAQPELDTSLWLVAWDGDQVAGSVLNFIFATENARLGIRRGWLEHVSVRRPWRHRGLASALIAQSMRRLRDRGIDEAALGADSENLSGAVRIYEALGFSRVRTAANYRKSIAVPPREGRP